jgi:hypothetical protein
VEKVNFFVFEVSVNLKSDYAYNPKRGNGSKPNVYHWKRMLGWECFLLVRARKVVRVWIANRKMNRLLIMIYNKFCDE